MAVRALAPTHDEDDRQRGIQPEFLRRDRAVDPGETTPHRRTGHHAMRFAQIIRAALKPSSVLFTHGAIIFVTRPGIAFDS